MTLNLLNGSLTLDTGWPFTCRSNGENHSGRTAAQVGGDTPERRNGHV